MGLNSRYEIRVKGILDGRWAAGSGTFRSPATGRNRHLRPARRSGALHGLLAKVRDLGLFLISVRHLDPD